jgi:hypothetical protein
MNIFIKIIYGLLFLLAGMARMARTFKRGWIMYKDKD